MICDDPDVPMPQPFVHWVIYKIPGDREGTAGEHPDRSRRRAMPTEIAGAVQGTSGFRRPIYRGPAPPPASRTTITSRCTRSTRCSI